MKPEDLFAAIGGVESSRLERSELAINPSSQSRQEERNMYQKKHRRLLPNILVAILIAAMLATTAFAAAGFILFENPMQMIDTLFGNKTGYDKAHWSVPDYKGNVAAEYHSDRTAVEEPVAEELAPKAEAIGQSITYAGHTLTVDANMFDAATKCGFVTYTIENPKGLPHYEVQPNGEVWFPTGELLDDNQYGKSYVIQEKCSDTELCASFYYQIRNPRNPNLELGFRSCDDKITIPANSGSEVLSVSLGNGTVILSPFSVNIDLKQLSAGEYVDELTLTFHDGTEYIVKDDTTLNCLFEVGNAECTEATMMMNRLVDVENVRSVTVNGVCIEKI